MLLIIILSLFVKTESIVVKPESLSELSPDKFFAGYHDYNQMTRFLSEIAKNYSDFATLYSIGRSVQQRELWVLKIQSPALFLGSPHIKFVGNIHGNEPVGRELILYLAEYLLRNYETDPDVRWILDRTNVYLLPSMNPDGFENSKEGDCYSGPGRENGNFVDLNRSFPDHFKENSVPAQPETLAITKWMSEVPFILSASFHGGALVANYPYDSNPENEKELLLPRSSLAPDDDVFRHLADTYSENHLTMHKGRTCNENQPSFPGGITNGAAWYSFTGGMQDYNYVSQGCMELTLEISCCKYPQAQHLPRLWSENKKAILEFSKQAQMGVRGIISDKKTSTYISGAKLYIENRNISFTSSKNGLFWRILLPGNYILVAEATGYEKQSFPFAVENVNPSYPSSTWLNVYLNPIHDLSAEGSSNTELTMDSSGSRPSLAFILLLFCLIFGLNSWKIDTS